MLLRRLDENAAAAPLLGCAALLSLGGAIALVTPSCCVWTSTIRTRVRVRAVRLVGSISAFRCRHPTSSNRGQ